MNVGVHGRGQPKARTDPLQLGLGVKLGSINKWTRFELPDGKPEAQPKYILPLVEFGFA